jgi:hypothetical protein
MTSREIRLSAAQVHETLREAPAASGWRTRGHEDLGESSSPGISRLIGHAGVEPAARRSA